MSTTTSSSSTSRNVLLSLLGLSAASLGGYAAYQRYRKSSHRKGAVADAPSPSPDPTQNIVTSTVPVIDLTTFLTRSETDRAKWESDCKLIAQLLHEYGILIIKDPRVRESDNDTFLSMMEQYFEQPEEVRAEDVREEYTFQVGVTPPGKERARNHCARIAKLDPNEKPLTLCPPELDPKCRFFWRMGEAPTETEFPRLNMPPVVPRNFPQWTQVMNQWGNFMLDAVTTVAEMSAIGLGLPANQFTDMLHQGPHLLAPTGSDLANNGHLGTVFASYHYDLNFLSIHGRSRFPGLFIWTREGKKVQVKVPPQCLLLQAGKQFEWMTGGHVLAGFHEVVVVPDTLKAVETAKAANRSLWRISSTLFGHINSDKVLAPVGSFKTEEALAKYPPTKAGNYVQNELAAIYNAGMAGMV